MAELAEQPANQAAYRVWPGGMDSWTAAFGVSQQQYVYGQNILNKGGTPQTRPGSRSLACMERGNPQGIGMFTPENGVTHLLSAVNGSIFVSPQPFNDWRQLIGLNFNPASKFVTFTECLKTTDYDVDGEIFYLDKPYRVVIIQDANTRAAYWDGSVHQHQNPTPSGLDLTVDNRDETKIGLWSVYSNNRLWVARGRFVFASDIGNPQKFHESQYLNEAPAFILEDDCTGIIETPDRSGILCFYENGADFIQSAIQDRTLWLDTPEFQHKVLNVGCIAPRSLINQHGLIYWFSDRGWISQNDALRQFNTSVLDPLDDEMAYSKARLGPNLTRIAAGTIENLSLVSVPFCSLKNEHTWVLDSLPSEDIEKANAAWASVWTAWRPVCWVSGDVDGYQRIFFISADTDGHNRIWEGMTSDRKDNGCAITCSVQFRQEDFDDPLQIKRFRFAEVEFGQMAGDVTAMIAVAGSRGWFDRIATNYMVATYERVQYDQTYGIGTAEQPKLSSSRKQARILRSEEWVQPSDCNACGVEGNRPVNFDYAFNVFIGWSGRAAITRLWMVASSETQNLERGDCPPDEEGPNVVDGGGCSAKELYPVLDPAFPKFFATSIQDSVNHLGDPISWEASAFSQISQADAQRRADCKAWQQLLINSTLAVGIPELLVYTEDGQTLIGDLIDFGYWLAGQTGEITVRLVNVGNGILELGSINIPDALSFTITAGPDIVSLDPDAFTFITIKFESVEGEGISLDVPEIVSALVDSTEVNSPYSYQIVATGDPISYGATNLPAGLSIDTATGIISGTPTVIAITNIGISATNAIGQEVSETLVLNVTSVLAPPYTPSAFAAADFTAAYGFRVLISGYVGNLFTLRRVSDDVELTFAAGYSPDTLTTWLSGTTGRVTEWFDQTGNGRHATQISTTLQPLFGFSSPNSYPSVENTTATRDYLQVAASNPCGAMCVVVNVDGGEGGGGLMSNAASENPSVRKTFDASPQWDTYDWPDTTRRISGAATSGVFVFGTWHTAYLARGAANYTFPNPHILLNAKISLLRTLNMQVAELLIGDFAKTTEVSNADAALVTFWGF